MKDYQYSIHEGWAVVCCRSSGCPAIRRLDEENVVIKDDDGNEIKISTDELIALADYAKNIL